MNGRLLRQALFSSPDSESHPPSTGSGHTQYLQSTRDSVYSPRPRSDSFFSGTTGAPQEFLFLHDTKLLGNTTSSSPPGAGPTDDRPRTERRQSAIPFAANAAQLLPRGPNVRTSGREDALDPLSHPVHQRKLRAFSQTRPGRSLHQRLDPGMTTNALCLTLSFSDTEAYTEDNQDPPPYPAVMASDHAAEAQVAQSLRVSEEMPPRVQSRSASVLSSVHGRHDDDLSSIMMRGATDLRHAKFELEEQVAPSMIQMAHICS